MAPYTGMQAALGMTFFPFCVSGALMVVLINFIGEALLQAFDPRRRGGMG